MDNATFDGMGEAQLLTLIAVYAVLLVLMTVIYVTIIRKAGYSGWWILTMLVPVVNVVMIAVFAFSEWPVTRELNAARAALQHQEMQQQAQSYNRFSWGG